MSISRKAEHIPKMVAKIAAQATFDAEKKMKGGLHHIPTIMDQMFEYMELYNSIAKKEELSRDNSYTRNFLMNTDKYQKIAENFLQFIIQVQGCHFDGLKSSSEEDNILYSVMLCYSIYVNVVWLERVLMLQSSNAERVQHLFPVFGVNSHDDLRKEIKGIYSQFQQQLREIDHLIADLIHTGSIHLFLSNIMISIGKTKSAGYVVCEFIDQYHRKEAVPDPSIFQKTIKNTLAQISTIKELYFNHAASRIEEKKSNPVHVRPVAETATSPAAKQPTRASKPKPQSVPTTPAAGTRLSQNVSESAPAPVLSTRKPTAKSRAMAKRNALNLPTNSPAIPTESSSSPAMILGRLQIPAHNTSLPSLEFPDTPLPDLEFPALPFNQAVTDVDAELSNRRIPLFSPLPQGSSQRVPQAVTPTRRDVIDLTLQDDGSQQLVKRRRIGKKQY